MRKICLLAALGAAALASGAFAQSTVYVRPHVRSDGTVVQGHYRTAPNSTPNDNWSTRPNINPYTGREGTKEPEPYSPYPAPRATQRPR